MGRDGIAFSSILSPDNVQEAIRLNKLLIDKTQFSGEWLPETSESVERHIEISGMKHIHRIITLEWFGLEGSFMIT